MVFLQKIKQSVQGKKNVHNQVREPIQKKQGIEEEELFELEESDNEAVDLEREAAYIREELAAAKLELITGKEERINWRHFFEILLRK